MEKAKLLKMDVLAPLPDVFMKADGTRVASPEEWEEHRKELYRTAVELQYGGMPPEPEFLEAELLYRHVSAQRASSYRIHTGRRDKEITFTMQVVWPDSNPGKHPIIVDGDGCFPYVYFDENLDVIGKAGAALIRFNRTELAHDLKEDVHTDGLYGVYPGMTFSALAAWAWGYHRCVDAAIKLGIADESLIAFTGHSRGGKTALLAGATDTRATIVNPNGSGAGGAGCYRVHSLTHREDNTEQRSEELTDLLRNFPFWFGPDMKKYAEDESTLPFDEHFLKALVAPRVLLDTEALSDGWANPVGAYMTHLAVGEVYDFLGVPERNLIHYRDGFHFHKPEDLEVLTAVICHMRDGAPLPEDVNKTPFDGTAPSHEWKKP
ncbi:MAG: hypothetical protein E7662_05900 [Ruminococcaceae bacterium]|nr:hypothetical protein [Oscillospiraceae bacterium]